MLNNPNTTTSHSNDSDEWETLSESDSLDRPLTRNEMHRLTEIPMGLLSESKSINWIAPILNFKHEHKCYERVMVNTIIFLCHYYT